MRSRGRTPEGQLPLGLPEGRGLLPPHDHFPANFAGETVGARVTEDLVAGAHRLLVAGYTSLEELLRILRRLDDAHPDGPIRPTRMLLGTEPSVGREAARRVRSPSVEVIEFWLDEGVSLLRSADVFRALELLDLGRLEVRTSGATRVHAKIYATDRTVTLGSSNFTASGLRRNVEANVRFEVEDGTNRFEEACRLAESIWDVGENFQDGFRALLGSLVRKVDWREALARACGELLEGTWAERYRDAGDDTRPALWPSQEQGIAQALWVLENEGSVLVADATGSGKTRLAARLIQTLEERNWRTGRTRRRMPTMVCPPVLRPAWRGEFAQIGEGVAVFSHGVLSHRGAERREELKETFRRAQVLAVDEAHNFLNPRSQRSRLLYGNVADHVVLLTATPINRGPADLLAMIDLLGADNFDDSVLEVMEKLGGGGPKSLARRLSEREIERIRGALQRFVVRRTKAELNELIELEPERYVNALGKPCRYPRHDAERFERPATGPDRGRAAAIREKAKNLRGIINIRKALQMPKGWEAVGWTPERFLDMRLEGARALAAYQVRSRLRSSRAALIEHIEGTAAACREFGLGRVKQRSTGNVLKTLDGLRSRLPVNRLGVELPEWLADADAYAYAVDEEIETYRQILGLTRDMSDARQDANLDRLLDLLERHARVIAFDSHLISLYDLRARLERREPDVAVVLATGEGGMQARRDFGRRFGLDAAEERVIGLCSDALAEGLNLQGASAVVHLDLPSVMRLLEQRVGRVDRMDTSHEVVEVHWPEDPPEFGLSSDDKFLFRLRVVEDLLGSNVPMPPHLREDPPPQEEAVPLGDLIREVEEEIEHGRASDSLGDAFGEVRGLVRGEDALVPPETYRALRTAKGRVLSSVAVVRTSSPWVFVALGAADRSVPRWALVDLGSKSGAPPELRVDVVAGALRDRLEAQPADVAFDERAAVHLEAALRVLQAHERRLIPRRKQRALEEMEAVLEAYRRAARRKSDVAREAAVERIVRLLATPPDGRSTDFGRLADWWLEVVRPVWYGHLVSPRVRRPARLGHIRKRLIQEPIDTATLAACPVEDLVTTSLDRRVVACIVGVGEGAGQGSRRPEG